MKASLHFVASVFTDGKSTIKHNRQVDQKWMFKIEFGKETPESASITLEDVYHDLYYSRWSFIARRGYDLALMWAL